MAARGLGRSMSAIQKSALALWAPSSPKVHIQGNLSTGFRENRGQERMPLLLSQLPGLGPAPSYIGPSFPSTELVWMRAMCRSAWVGVQVGSSLDSSGSLDGHLYHIFTQRCLWRAKHTWAPFWLLGALLLLQSEGRPSQKHGPQG